ncbi:MAG: outer membrane lipoprotein-sorting protein [Acidobacteria bacterium]|nr:outer membrane lipoprotein-sorting protein [Acidobacteriota bacterium]
MRSGFVSKVSENFFAWLLVGLLSISAVPCRVAAAEGTDLSKASLEFILARMDEASARFASVSGNLDYTKVTVIVDDHSTETGKIYFEKNKGRTRVLIAFDKPAEKYVLFEDGKVSIYRPKIAEVEEYSVGDRQELLEQFLLLGFGTPGRELQKAYGVRLLGEETLNGQKTFHVELVPKSETVTRQLARVELWISSQTWQPVQQKFVEPSQDYLLARYRDLIQNVKIPAQNFRLPLRGKVRTVRPQAP